MKVAYFEELLNLVPNGGMAVWANRFTEYLNNNGIKADLYSYSNLKTIIPDNIKVYPNLREIFIFPSLGKKMLKLGMAEWNNLINIQQQLNTKLGAA